MRYSLPNSPIMVHQPSGGYQGQATDIMIHAEQTLKIKKRLNEIYSEHSGQPIEVGRGGAGARPLHDPRGGQGLGPIDEIVSKRDVPAKAA